MREKKKGKKGYRYGAIEAAVSRVSGARSQGCRLTLTAGATPARSGFSLARGNTALALRGHSRAPRPGYRGKGRRGKTQYDPGRARGDGVTTVHGAGLLRVFSAAATLRFYSAVDFFF